MAKDIKRDRMSIAVRLGKESVLLHTRKAGPMRHKLAKRNWRRDGRKVVRDALKEY